MRLIADLHIHSKYSRATSKDMNLDTLAEWAKIKGIDILGTGDFTHPAYFASIEGKLEETGKGLLTLKKAGKKSSPAFMLSAEVSSIYTQSGKTRKIHSLLFAPDLKAARKINSALSRLGNVSSDGRPIFGFNVRDLVKVALDASGDCLVVPAHAWTPWFSIFGSKSGFDSIEECFGEYSKYIYAIETGLSSNPQMNWRLSALDKITLISNSDAHSPAKLGRETNVFDCSADYYEIMDILKKKDKKKFLYTTEFYPEEGKYHADGHRLCGISFTPDETKKAGGQCPVCSKPLTVGVLSRVEELADRPMGFTPEGAIPARHLVPLQEIIAETLGVNANSIKVKREYKKLVTSGHSEFQILLDLNEEELIKAAGEKTAEAVMRVRSGNISILPGFDGEFGKIKIFGKTEAPKPTGARQERLF